MPDSLGRDSLSPTDLANQVARHVAETIAPTRSSWLRDSVLVGRLISGIVLVGMVTALVGGTYFGVSWLAGRSSAGVVDVLSGQVTPDSSADGDTTTPIQKLSSDVEVTTASTPFVAGSPAMSPTPSEPPSTSRTTEIPGLPAPPPVVSPTLPTIPSPPSTTPTTSPATPPMTTTPEPGATTTTIATTTTSEPGTTTTVVEATTTTCRGNSGGGSGSGPCGP